MLQFSLLALASFLLIIMVPRISLSGNKCIPSTLQVQGRKGITFIYKRSFSWGSGHAFVLVGSNPTVVTARAGVDKAAEKSPSLGAMVPCSRRYGRRAPRTVLLLLYLAGNCYDPVRSGYLD